MPVMMDDRDGAHTPYTEYAFVYRAPCDASLSKFGVRASGTP
jgi:hypothetical protein